MSLWRGVGPTLWRDVPFSGIYWASYEAWKEALHRVVDRRASTVVEGGRSARVRRGKRADPRIAFVSGAISGMTAAIITQPFDVLKTRRQAFLMDSAGGGQVRTGSIYLIRKVLSTEGVSALFAGMTPRIAKIAPACGVMIACFEVCSVRF